MQYWELDQHLPPKRLLKLPGSENKMMIQNAVILIMKDGMTRKQMTEEVMTRETLLCCSHKPDQEFPITD
ncbi:hypothetical protein ScPMuIL_002624 [Solemya velum]